MKLQTASAWLSQRMRGLSRSGLVVLNYHRVGTPDPLFDQGVWSATESDFGEQLRLCKRHLDMISLDDLPAVAGRRGLYGLITFDDGYRDNYERAFPLLAAEGIKATFFVTTQFLDTPQLSWWDWIASRVRSSRRAGIELPDWLPEPLVFDEPTREASVRKLLRVYKKLPSERTPAYLQAIAAVTEPSAAESNAASMWMTWDMVREMRKAGMVIAGHTVTHSVLSRMQPDQQRAEIFGCASRLTQELGEPMLYFSYPVGGPQSFDATTRACLREAGVRYAFSYYGGFRSFSDWDDYDIRRVAVETDVSLKQLSRIVSVPQLFA